MSDVIRYVNKETGKWESIDAVSGEVITNEKMYTPEKRIPYSLDIARQLCMLIRDGASAKDACNKLKITYNTFCLWKYRYPDFREGVMDARKDAAEMFAHKAMEELENTPGDKIEMDRMKLAVSTYQWFAEKADPQSYGKQTKITGDASQPLTLVVNTGIQRGEEP